MFLELQRFRPPKISVRLTHQFVQYLRADFTLIHPKYARQNAKAVYEEPYYVEVQDGKIRLRLFPEVEQFCAKALKSWPSGIFVRFCGKAFRDCGAWLHQLRITHVEDLLLAAKSSELTLELLESLCQGLAPELWHDHLVLTAEEHRQVSRNNCYRLFFKPRLVRVLRRAGQSPPFSLFEHIEPHEDCVVDVEVRGKQIIVYDVVPWGGCTNPFGDWTSQCTGLVVEDWPDQDLSRYRVPCELGDSEDCTQQLLQLQKMMKQIG